MQNSPHFAQATAKQKLNRYRRLVGELSELQEELFDAGLIRRKPLMTRRHLSYGMTRRDMTAGDW
jgi:hypothetical protein